MADLLSCVFPTCASQAFSLKSLFFHFILHLFTFVVKMLNWNVLRVKDGIHKSFTWNSCLSWWMYWFFTCNFWNAYGYEFFSIRLRIQSCTLWIFFCTVMVKLVTVRKYISARLWVKRPDEKRWFVNIQYCFELWRGEKGERAVFLWWRTGPVKDFLSVKDDVKDRARNVKDVKDNPSHIIRCL